MSLAEIKDKVQRYLLDMGLHGIEVTRDGYTFAYESVRVYVDIVEVGDGDSAFTYVKTYAFVVSELRPTAELFEYVARHADDWVFGHLGLFEDANDKSLSMVLAHRILADYLDPEELQRTVGAVAVTANDIDDELAAKFGGKTYAAE